MNVATTNWQWDGMRHEVEYMRTSGITSHRWGRPNSGAGVLKTHTHNPMCAYPFLGNYDFLKIILNWPTSVGMYISFLQWVLCEAFLQYLGGHLCQTLRVGFFDIPSYFAIENKTGQRQILISDGFLCFKTYFCHWFPNVLTFFLAN